MGVIKSDLVVKQSPPESNANDTVTSLRTLTSLSNEMMNSSLSTSGIFALFTSTPDPSSVDPNQMNPGGGTQPYGSRGSETDTVLTEIPVSASSVIISRSLVSMATVCNNVSCKAAQVHNNASAQLSEAVMTGKDASWILTSAVIIFTMQTGFGLLESGAVSPKNEVNIMVKNALDVVFGGITYWAFGFGLSFGTSEGTNPFIGVGSFLFDSDDENMGYNYSLFLFQLSFSTTATTIVSGAMAERTKLSAYIVFSLVNTIIYSVPAHWIWAETGFLYQLGAIDVAGCGPVHLVGGVTGLVATLLLKPRLGAFDNEERKPLPAPLKAILGMFMLWWGWLRFNSGSVFIISDSSEWRLAVRAAVNTMVASMGGGITGVIISVLQGCVRRSHRYNISVMVNGVLGSLVSITSMCTLARPWEALVAGCIGAMLASATDLLVYKLKIDDPVGVISVHGACSIWGLLTVGLFLEPKYSAIDGKGGLLKTGEWYMLGVQAMSAVTIIVWTSLISWLTLKVIDLTLGLRLSVEEEEMGADILEHGVAGRLAAKVEAKKALDHMVDNGDHEKQFKNKLNLLFLDVSRSCDKNDLLLTVVNSNTNSVSFELKFVEKTPSVDSGVELQIG